jgi:hypothetical protein
MRLTNDSHLILIGNGRKTVVARYVRDSGGWLKVSSRGRVFRMTAEQVLNHVQPAVAGLEPRETIEVVRRDVVVWTPLESGNLAPSSPRSTPAAPDGDRRG